MRVRVLCSFSSNPRHQCFFKYCGSARGNPDGEAPDRNQDSSMSERCPPASFRRSPTGSEHSETFRDVGAPCAGTGPPTSLANSRWIKVADESLKTRQEASRCELKQKFIWCFSGTAALHLVLLQDLELLGAIQFLFLRDPQSRDCHKISCTVNSRTLWPQSIPWNPKSIETHMSWGHCLRARPAIPWAICGARLGHSSHHARRHLHAPGIFHTRCEAKRSPPASEYPPWERPSPERQSMSMFEQSAPSSCHSLRGTWVSVLSMHMKELYCVISYFLRDPDVTANSVQDPALDSLPAAVFGLLHPFYRPSHAVVSCDPDVHHCFRRSGAGQCELAGRIACWSCLWLAVPLSRKNVLAANKDSFLAQIT